MLELYRTIPANARSQPASFTISIPDDTLAELIEAIWDWIRNLQRPLGGLQIWNNARVAHWCKGPVGEVRLVSHCYALHSCCLKASCWGVLELISALEGLNPIRWRWVSNPFHWTLLREEDAIPILMLHDRPGAWCQIPSVCSANKQLNRQFPGVPLNYVNIGEAIYTSYFALSHHYSLITRIHIFFSCSSS